MLKFIKTLFYGNVFYGLCTVALSIESNLQHSISLNSFRFYLLVFLSTIVYYGRIYYKSSAVVIDDRSSWYKPRRPLIGKTLILLTSIIVVDIIWLVWLNIPVLLNMNLYHWSLFAVVPVLGLMYTFQVLPVKNLRRIGWVKPFIIGFVWAGVVTIFPVLFWQIRNPNEPAPALLLKILIWVQNFLFISVLAIVFDIKDYKMDVRHRLNTYPVRYGVKNTVQYIILPLAVLSFATLIITTNILEHTLLSILIQTLPYLLLLIIITNFLKEKTLLFYLAAVDGLMLLKAICGIVAMSLLK